ncbi:hypothetical protein RRG08_039146, partial [Elysia crispata]
LPGSHINRWYTLPTWYTFCKLFYNPGSLSTDGIHSLPGTHSGKLFYNPGSLSTDGIHSLPGTHSGKLFYNPGSLSTDGLLPTWYTFWQALLSPWLLINRWYTPYLVHILESSFITLVPYQQMVYSLPGTHSGKLFYNPGFHINRWLLLHNFSHSGKLFYNPGSLSTDGIHSLPGTHSGKLGSQSPSTHSWSDETIIWNPKEQDGRLSQH